jgi:hypothetical protein
MVQPINRNRKEAYYDDDDKDDEEAFIQRPKRLPSATPNPKTPTANTNPW